MLLGIRIGWESMNLGNRNLEKPSLKTLELKPENKETPIHFLRDWLTPVEYFYKRSHFPYPEITAQSFFLPVSGQVERPLVFHYCYLKSMPSVEITMVLECSGNKRAAFEPRTYGEQWQDGAISQGNWKGVLLKDILKLTGVKGSAKEVVFIGHDKGTRTDMEGVFHYARSLPIDMVLQQDILIAYELNGRSIPYEQGFPLRLIVPQWYGMASVKWLKEIQVIDYEFEGPFQTVDYVYYPNKENDEGASPVTNVKIDSIIQKPLDYSTLDTGNHEIYGIAWSGHGKINNVELSLDNGSTWVKTKLYSDRNQKFSWTFWSYQWEAREKGEYTILCRASDSNGNIQPFEAKWNRKGYGYNAVYTIHVKIE